jgi:PEP-CTERM motif
MIKSTKAFLLAGASALAILATAAEANAETFTIPGEFSFIATVSGEYAVELLGGSGGNSTGGGGGFGAEVSGDVFLTAGEDLTLIVGGHGKSGTEGAGGGGGTFVFHGTDVLAVAGGGGGASNLKSGGYGLAGTSGGGGGEGVSGGVGGKGGGAAQGDGGGGGGSYLASLFQDQVLKAGVNSGNGSINIELLKAVPEPSTWAMMLAGFAGLGWLAHTRRHKPSPA